MDEVLCQWGARILQWYNLDKETEARNKGDVWTAVRLDSISNWDMKMNLGPESEVYIRSYMRYPNFYRELDPIPGAVKAMQKLLADGHDVLVTTAIPKCAGLAYEGKKEWLRHFIPEFPLDNLIGVKRKDVIEADVLIDDGLHNIVPFFEKGRNAIVFDAPWNRNNPKEAKMTNTKRFFRCRSWEHVLSTIDWIQTQYTF